MNVNGTIRATPIEGEMPGIAPARIPTTTPTVITRRDWRFIILTKPFKRFVTTTGITPPEPGLDVENGPYDAAQRQAYVQQPVEDEIRERHP